MTTRRYPEAGQCAVNAATCQSVQAARCGSHTHDRESESAYDRRNGIHASCIEKVMQRWQKHVHPVLSDNQDRFSQCNQDRPLEQYSFVALDTELTGLNHRRDTIVSIGAVRIRGLSIDPSDTFHALVRPESHMGKAATLVHRITPQQLAAAPLLRDVLPECLAWCGDSFLVGHGIGLDMRFMNRAARQWLGGSIATPCIDTMRLAQAYEQECWEKSFDPFQPQVSYTLTDLARRYGLPLFTAHDALEDAMQTAYLFVYLARKLRSGSIATLRDLFMAGRSWRWYL